LILSNFSFSSLNFRICSFWRFNMSSSWSCSLLLAMACSLGETICIRVKLPPYIWSPVLKDSPPIRSSRRISGGPSLILCSILATSWILRPAAGRSPSHSRRFGWQSSRAPSAVLPGRRHPRAGSVGGFLACWTWWWCRAPWWYYWHCFIFQWGKGLHPCASDTSQLSPSAQAEVSGSLFGGTRHPVVRGLPSLSI